MYAICSDPEAIPEFQIKTSTPSPHPTTQTENGSLFCIKQKDAFTED